MNQTSLYYAINDASLAAMTAGPARDLPSLIAALTHASAQIERILDRAAAEYGVTPVQARLLRVLSDGAPTMSELAAQLGLDRSSSSGLVDRAHGRGLVRRLPSQLDRRSVRVRLTARGRELAADIAALAGEELAAICEPLSDADRSVLTAALAQLGSA